jgi:sec-independent protein translocase protein TatB
MQFLGIGLPELLLILILTVIVVGPERLPEVAAQLARFIRQAQAYANYVRKDFNEVIGELEKEVGTNREDLKTIAEAFRRDTSSVFEEIDKAGKEVQEATDLEKAAGGSILPTGASPNGQNGHRDESEPVESTAVKEAAMEEAEATAEAGAAAQPDEWFKPTPGRRRRRSGESVQ